jgi:outer membrane protein
MRVILSVILGTVISFAAYSAELKIGTIDLQRAMTDYYKWDEVTQQIKQRDTSYVKELEPLRLEGTRLEREARELALSIQDNALSSSVRDEKKKLFEQKQVDLGEIRMRFDDLQLKRQTDLQKYSVQTRKQIADDVLTVTRKIGETEGFNLILNANKAEPISADVLFSKNVDDITEKVLARLNAGKPRQSAEPKRQTAP